MLAKCKQIIESTGLNVTKKKETSGERENSQLGMHRNDKRTLVASFLHKHILELFLVSRAAL